jgi:hypothetical protein
MLVERKDQAHHEILFKNSLNEVADIIIASGGKPASQKLAAILKHLVSKSAI